MSEEKKVCVEAELHYATDTEVAKIDDTIRKYGFDPKDMKAGIVNAVNSLTVSLSIVMAGAVDRGIVGACGPKYRRLASCIAEIFQIATEISNESHAKAHANCEGAKEVVN